MLEVEVYYPFHPLFRSTAMVVGTQVHDHVRYLTARTGDGSSFLLPAWMTTPEAARIEILADPALPLKQLLELRAILDSVLASSNGKLSPS